MPLHNTLHSFLFYFLSSSSAPPHTPSSTTKPYHCNFCAPPKTLLLPYTVITPPCTSLTLPPHHRQSFLIEHSYGHDKNKLRAGPQYPETTRLRSHHRIQRHISLPNGTRAHKHTRTPYPPSPHIHTHTLKKKKYIFSTHPHSFTVTKAYHYLWRNRTYPLSFLLPLSLSLSPSMFSLTTSEKDK